MAAKGPRNAKARRIIKEVKETKEETKEKEKEEEEKEEEEKDDENESDQSISNYEKSIIIIKGRFRNIKL